MIAAGLVSVSARQDPAPAAPAETKAPEALMTALTNTPVKEIEPGIYEIGLVRLDSKARTVTFPATLNKARGLMEYFVVTAYGKTHESILKTKAEPYHIHLAMVLLGAHGPGDTNFSGAPADGVPGPIVHPSRDSVPGDKAGVTVKWKNGQDEVRHAAEEMVWKKDDRKTMGQGMWTYNGSLIVHNKFLAQLDGSLISLVTDPVALVNNTGPGHENDLIWEPNTNNLPPASTPVEVTITLAGPPKPD